MKKVRNSEAVDMPREIDFRDGERGRYARRFAEGTNLVLLAPDVAEVFPDSEAVNAALRVVLRASARASQPKRNRRRAG
jgi:hypothetical protein